MGMENSTAKQATQEIKQGMEQQITKIKNKHSIEQYMKFQFARIGVLVGIIVGVLGCYAGYEGVVIAKYKDANTSSTVGMIIAVIGVLVMAVIVFAVISFCLTKVRKQICSRIEEPVGLMDQIMDELSKGNLSREIDYQATDEFTNMMNNATIATNELRGYIHDITRVLEQIGDKNMELTIDKEYLGEFSAIQESMNRIVDSLNDTFGEMRVSFSQVRDGAETLAVAAQNMAEGAQQQEHHVQQLVENIKNASQSVHNNTMAAEGVEQLSQESMVRMQQGEEKMQELSGAMDSIRKESKEIENIIAVIVGIAEQTNLLALNASIEAARAGEHGKGFAVVAGEIGTLAQSSAEASKNITELIEKSIVAVDNGVSITEQTVDMLQGIADISGEISGKITDITSDSRKQDAYLNDMLSSAQEIASVVDQNSAAAQESSALSEELLSHSETVMAMIEEYRLREK